MTLPASQHRSIPRRRLIGEDGWRWIKDAAAGAALILFCAAVLALCHGFPRGIADLYLSDLHIALVGGGKSIPLFH